MSGIEQLKNQGDRPSPC